MNKTNVKGTDYDLAFISSVIVNGADICDGLTDVANKWIELSLSTHDCMVERVIYHELIHAFLYECGLSKYYEDETLVDWFASQIQNIEKNAQKILKEFKRRKDGQR